MNKARKASDEANDKAFEARQRAVKLQFEANGAADMAAVSAEMLATVQDQDVVASMAKTRSSDSHS
ncbi:hypothetical protein [Cohnella rhizosphaerae]|uniref:Uncharacterized protein n=1 Tax=Cohnella rhizosphaerae TaxID=1457232 RepID=A0A9X4L1X9_9BACL|nr:hypothetical protein [Cohnella rhizosphaerae]MDG0814621.1 hypothetical protein [Cohnella rhizosphaerae]